MHYPEVEVTALTVESQRIGTFYDRVSERNWNLETPHPYARIIGLRVEEEKELMAPINYAALGHEPYNSSDVRERTLRLNEHLAKRLAGFFAKFLEPKDSPLGKFNCHYFAGWMSGLDQPSSRQPNEHISLGSLVNGNLSLGEHGVVGYVQGEGDGYAQHSVIGLGDDNPEGLQIMWGNGQLGIMPYDPILSFYRRHSGNTLKRLAGKVRAHGLYSMR